MEEIKLAIHDTVRELRDGYAKQLSDLDQELSDIYHYIEFENLDAYRGWKAYRKLKDVLVKRREVKDSIDVANSINSKLTSEYIVSVEKMRNRKYTPRKINMKEVI